MSVDPGATPPPRPVPGSTVLVLATAVAAVLGGAIGGLVAHHADGAARQRDQVTLGAPTASAGIAVQRPEGSVAAVAARILPSVVSLDVRRGTSGDTGTGIVISASGYILTNNHVIADVARGARLAVVFADEQQVPGTVVGRDTVNDLAVVRVDNVHGLRAATLGSSAGLAVGDPVIAVGSPLGLAGTVTTGIISALDRPVAAGDASGNADDLIDAIQTDAAINPGNSGGPLLDAAGHVLGLNDQIQTNSGSSAGVGFAIASNTVARIANLIIAGRPVKHSYVGVELNGNSAGGAQVTQVQQGSPAASAGVQPGDVITAIDGRPLTSTATFIQTVDSYAPGTKITLTLRGGRTVTLTLGTRPATSPGG